MNVRQIINKFGTAVLFGLFGTVLMGSVAMADFAPGVTVTEDANSPTGYTATFVYEDAEASEVKLLGTFSFYESGGDAGVIPEKFYGPEEWKPDMFRASFGDAGAWQGDMVKEEGSDYWTISIPLPGGHYQYFYNVDGAEENIPDPANMPITSEVENGGRTGTSTFDVPYNEEKHGGIDWSFIVPREDTEKGEYSFVNYEDINGDTRVLGVYLPAGYDAQAETPYNVFYLTHGGGGNETEPFNQGNVDVIFDNLIADGEVAPTIIVTMNNTVYSWDYDVINKNLMECIIPYIEKNYNVKADASGRAFAGISMGAMTASNVYYAHPDAFGYIGIFCGADASVDLTALDLKKLSMPDLLVGGGIYDGAYMNDSYQTEEDRSTVGLMDHLDELGLPYMAHVPKGGHDYASTWPQLIRVFATKVLWK